MSNTLIKYQFYNMKDFLEVQELLPVPSMICHQKGIATGKGTVWVLLRLLIILLPNPVCDLSHQDFIVLKKLMILLLLILCRSIHWSMKQNLHDVAIVLLYLWYYIKENSFAGKIIFCSLLLQLLSIISNNLLGLRP